MSIFSVLCVKDQVRNLQRITELKLRVTKVQIYVESILIFTSRLPKVSPEEQAVITNQIRNYVLLYREDLKFISEYSLLSKTKEIEALLTQGIDKEEVIIEKQIKHASKSKQDIIVFDQLLKESVANNSYVQFKLRELLCQLDERINYRTEQADKKVTETIFYIIGVCILVLVGSTLLGLYSLTRMFNFKERMAVKREN
jgi:hypothetical protein